MPCSLYFDSLKELTEKASSYISNKISAIKENKEKKIAKKEYEEKIKKLEAEKNSLTESNSLYTQENEKLQKMLQAQEEETNKIIKSKNSAIETFSKDFREQLEEKDKIITEQKSEIESLKKTTQPIQEQKEEENKNKRFEDFRKKYPANIRCQDGHYVRSKSERDIDDFFFHNKIRHVYEPTYINQKTKKSKCPDFYLPDYNLYIEYFGLKTEKYLKDKEEKIRLYSSDKNVNFEYITQNDDDNIYEKLKYICIKYSIPIK